jgi:hypothetical protein
MAHMLAMQCPLVGFGPRAMSDLHPVCVQKNERASWVSQAFSGMAGGTLNVVCRRVLQFGRYRGIPGVARTSRNCRG